MNKLSSFFKDDRKVAKAISATAIVLAVALILPLANINVLAEYFTIPNYGYFGGSYGYGYGYTAGYGYSSAPPSTPASFSCAGASATSVTCTWDEPTTAQDGTSLTNFTQYELYYADSSSSANRTDGTLASFSGSTTRATETATITGLTSGFNYFVLYVLDNNSNYSAVTSIQSVKVGSSGGTGGSGSSSSSGSSYVPPATTTPSTTTPNTTTPSTTPSSSTGSTPSVPGVTGESLRGGNFAYGFARVASLKTEQGLASSLAGSLETAFGKATFNALFRQAVGKSKAWWYAYVNAYTYGGYTLAEIKQGVKFGGKTVHPTIPASAWRNSADYKAYINR